MIHCRHHFPVHWCQLITSVSAVFLIHIQPYSWVFMIPTFEKCLCCFRNIIRVFVYTQTIAFHLSSLYFHCGILFYLYLSSLYFHYVIFFPLYLSYMFFHWIVFLSLHSYPLYFQYGIISIVPLYHIFVQIIISCFHLGVFFLFFRVLLTVWLCIVPTLGL